MCRVLSKKIRNHCKYDSVELSMRARGCAESEGPPKCRAAGVVPSFPENKRYEDVWFNGVSIMRDGWALIFQK